MCASVTNKYGKTALIYALISIFIALFGAVYEYFSFGVYSYHMLYAFAYPLLGGAVPALILNLRSESKVSWGITRYLYRCGIATLTVGSIILGVLEIYGTTNQLVQWYWYIGISVIVISVLVGLVEILLGHRKTPPI